MNTLPFELLREIVGHFNSITGPVIGEDAAWTLPRSICNWWKEDLVLPDFDEEKDAKNFQELSQGQDSSSDDDKNSRSSTEVGWKLITEGSQIEHMSLSDEDSDDEYAESSDQSVQGWQLQKIPTPQQTLRALRQVNRQFNELCTPLLYQELNFLSGGITSQSVHYFVAANYGQHVRTLRILTNGIARQVPEESILKILGYCHNITSLGLYYNSISSPTSFKLSSTLPNTIVRMIKEGSLESIGFYSCKVVQDNFMHKDVPFAGPLFDEIAQSESASLLKRLDIALPRVPATTRDLICSRFTSLQSLTVRKALRRLDGSIWSGGCCKIWASYDNLTSLQLIGCTSVYPPDVPELVQHFTSLQHLLISACGDPSDVEPPPRPQGWSLMRTGWWHHRRPLKSLHLEHMIHWEILAMGSIPVEELIAVSLFATHLGSSFNVDPEIYPHLRVLRAESLETGFGSDINREREKEVAPALQQLCDKRGIELKRDGKWIIHSRYALWS